MKMYTNPEVIHLLIHGQHYPHINPFTLIVPLESIVCYSHTFENNLGIKQNFHKIFERGLLWGI